jgi:hypothetical protein
MDNSWTCWSSSNEAAKMKKQTIFWILAVVVTIVTVIYQRKTGPTYPVKRNIEIAGTTIEVSLPRSHGGNTDREISILVPGEDIRGLIIYKRYKTEDPLDTLQMRLQGHELVGYLPHQPPAGKLAYTVILLQDGTRYLVNDVPVIIRFKGSVPAFVLIPHILFIFTAQLLSLVAGLFAIYRLPRYKLYGILTIALLFVGGFILGPVIQKYAFGAFWTGFPFGQDMTDNKVLVAMLFWILAAVMNIRRDRPAYAWIAALVFFLVNMIPHSMFGSELEYDTGVITTGMVMII